MNRQSIWRSSEISFASQSLIFSTTEEQDIRQSALWDTAHPAGRGWHRCRGMQGARAKRFLAQYAAELEGREFILYMGRVDASKGCRQLFSHFMRFREDVPAHPLKLVLLGSQAMEIPPHPDIVALGFVSEQVKYDAIAAAQVVMLPSPYESLSIVALEAWQQGKPVLANGACAVLRGQCNRSNGGLWYDDYAEFREALHLLMQKPHLREQLGTLGKDFVQRKYSWDHIEARYLELVTRVFNS